jgi:hypothetical protein
LRVCGSHRDSRVVHQACRRIAGHVRNESPEARQGAARYGLPFESTVDPTVGASPMSW